MMSITATMQRRCNPITTITEAAMWLMGSMLEKGTHFKGKSAMSAGGMLVPFFFYEVESIMATSKYAEVLHHYPGNSTIAFHCPLNDRYAPTLTVNHFRRAW